MSEKFLGLPWVVWGALALLVALLFIWIWPSKQASSLPTTSVRFLILRWGHAGVWLLLAISFFLRSLNGNPLNGPANLLSLLAWSLYLAFLFMVSTK